MNVVRSMSWTFYVSSPVTSYPQTFSVFEFGQLQFWLRHKCIACTHKIINDAVSGRRQQLAGNVYVSRFMYASISLPAGVIRVWHVFAWLRDSTKLLLSFCVVVAHIKHFTALILWVEKIRWDLCEVHRNGYHRSVYFAYIYTSCDLIGKCAVKMA